MKLTIDVPDKNVANAIISGRESGIRYWCNRIYHEGGYDCYVETDDDGGEAATHFVDERRIRKALEIMAVKYPSRFADIMRDRSDCDAGDILIQLACFGEVKYS